MVVWFVVIGVLGIVNIWTAPADSAARQPARSGALSDGRSDAPPFVVLGAVFLALTGGEALYADMGHVGAAAIRLAWFGLVLPALVLNYFGQGALRAGRSGGDRQSVLQTGARLGADPDGGARRRSPPSSPRRR